MENNTEFKIGDKVRIFQNINKNRRGTWGFQYDYMEPLIGKEGKITGYNDKNSYGENCWLLDIKYEGANLSVCERNLEHI